MSHFYGYLQGNRGVATRCGGKNTGIKAHLRSWKNDVIIYLFDEEDKDVLNIQVPKGLTVYVNGEKRRF